MAFYESPRFEVWFQNAYARILYWLLVIVIGCESIGEGHAFRKLVVHIEVGLSIADHYVSLLVLKELY